MNHTVKSAVPTSSGISKQTRSLSDLNMAVYDLDIASLSLAPDNNEPDTDSQETHQPKDITTAVKNVSSLVSIKVPGVTPANFELLDAFIRSFKRAEFVMYSVHERLVSSQNLPDGANRDKLAETLEAARTRLSERLKMISTD